jgi:hypothetical protein
MTLSSRPLARAWMRRLTFLLLTVLLTVLHTTSITTLSAFFLGSRPTLLLEYFIYRQFLPRDLKSKSHKWSIIKVLLLLRGHGVAHSGNASESPPHHSD